MSRIYFADLNETAEVAGNERAYAAMTAAQTLSQVLGFDGLWTPETEKEARLLFGDNYLFIPVSTCSKCGRAATSTDDRVRTHIRCLIGDISFAGRKIDLFSLALNTLLVSGSNVMKLLARVHGQCELHGFVAGYNRIWLANIVEEGLNSQILRAGRDWERVELLLRHNCKHPVVMSYSVTDEFPNWRWLSERDERVNEAKFYKWSQEKQWKRSIKALYASPEGCRLELLPETWDTFMFRHSDHRQSVSGFNVRRWLNERVFAQG